MTILYYSHPILDETSGRAKCNRRHRAGEDDDGWDSSTGRSGAAETVVLSPRPNGRDVGDSRDGIGDDRGTTDDTG